MSDQSIKAMSAEAVLKRATVAAEQQRLANEMLLPKGKTCADCIHLRRCVEVLGCTKPENTSCDFHPSKFRERTKQ